MDPIAVQSPVVEHALELMRERGLRASAARRLIVETLDAANRPLSAEQVAAGQPGRGPRLDLASVYRILDVLVGAGLAHNVALGPGPGLYALSVPHAREWLSCERCGSFRGVDPTALDDFRSAVRRRFGYEPSFTRFSMVGLCDACASLPTEETA